MMKLTISKLFSISLSLYLLPQTVLGKASAGIPESMNEISLPRPEHTDACVGLVISEVSIPAGGGMNRPLDVPRNAKFHPRCYVVINGGLKVYYHWEEPQQASMLHATGCGEWKALSRNNIQSSWPINCRITILNAGKFGPKCVCDRSGCRRDEPSPSANGPLRRHRDPSPTSNAHEADR